MTKPGLSDASIRNRLLLLAALWLAAALLATGLLLAHLFTAHAKEAFEAELAGQIEELAALADLDPQGRPAISKPPADPRFSRAYSGWYWLLLDERERILARSRSLWDAELDLPAPLPLAAFDLKGPRGMELRAVARKLRLNDQGEPVILLVAGPQERIVRASRDFSGHLAVALAVLALGLLGGTLLQVTWGLSPLKRLKQALADIRIGRRERLPDDFPIEVKELSSELNKLLEHNAKIVERARTHAGNLAHALKTPLAALMNKADAMTGAEGDELRELSREMSASITHHLKRARIAATRGVLGSRTEVADTAARLIQAIGKLKADRPLKSTLEGMRGIWFQGERQDLEEMLGVLIENAFTWARRRVRVTLAHDRGRLRIEIEDDGPGIPKDHRKLVLERGQRLDESQPGSGLGLSIACDLAQAYGGGVELGESEMGGLRVVLELPESGEA